MTSEQIQASYQLLERLSLDKKEASKYNYKSAMCKNYLNCPRGNKCNFAHSVEELRLPRCVFGKNCKGIGTFCNKDHEEKKMEEKKPNNNLFMYNYKSVLCKNYPNCPRGLSCSFAHSEQELRIPFCIFETECKGYKDGTCKKNHVRVDKPIIIEIDEDDLVEEDDIEEYDDPEMAKAILEITECTLRIYAKYHEALL